MGKTILWDFDNTLFQTKRFWREHLFPAFQHLGVSPEAAEAGFRAATAPGTGKRDHFVPHIILECIEEVSGVGAEQLRPVLEEVVYTGRGVPYFFPHALESVTAAQERGYRNLLLSYGDQAFKERWFRSIGLEHVFAPTDIYITNVRKGEMLSTLQLTHEVLIVNDVFNETESMIDNLLRSGHTVRGFHFVADPEKLTGEPTSEYITNFSSFATLTTLL